MNKVGEIRLLVHTKPKESGIGKKRPELFELDLSGDVASKFAYAKQKLGQEIKPEEVFKDQNTNSLFLTAAVSFVVRTPGSLLYSRILQKSEQHRLKPQLTLLKRNIWPLLTPYSFSFRVLSNQQHVKAIIQTPLFLSPCQPV